MPDLRLHRDEPETDPPAPLPFRSPDRSWRQAGTSEDSIKRVEQALSDVENKFAQLRELADELTDPIPLSEWLNNDDDDPWAA